MKNTVIFDLFGTLVYLADDSKPFLKLSRESQTYKIRESLTLSLLNEFNSLSEFSSIIGLNSHNGILDLENSLNKDINSAKLYADVISILKTLKKKGYRIILISNLATPYKKVITNLGIEKYFDTIVLSCECGFTKPNKKIYELALKSMNASPSECIMIGDSYKADVEGPLALGIDGYLLCRKKAENLKLREINSLLNILDIIT